MSSHDVCLLLEFVLNKQDRVLKRFMCLATMLKYSTATGTTTQVHYV